MILVSSSEVIVLANPGQRITQYLEGPWKLSAIHAYSFVPVTLRDQLLFDRCYEIPPRTQACNSSFESSIWFPLPFTGISENAYRQTMDLALGSGALQIYTRDNRIQNEHLNPILGSRSDL